MKRSQSFVFKCGVIRHGSSACDLGRGLQLQGTEEDQFGTWLLVESPKRRYELGGRWDRSKKKEPTSEESSFRAGGDGGRDRGRSGVKPGGRKSTNPRSPPGGAEGNLGIHKRGRKPFMVSDEIALRFMEGNKDHNDANNGEDITANNILPLKEVIGDAGQSHDLGDSISGESNAEPHKGGFANIYVGQWNQIK